MPEPPLEIPGEVLKDLENHISSTISSGKHIRNVLSQYSNRGVWDTDWEVQAAGVIDVESVRY